MNRIVVLGQDFLLLCLTEVNIPIYCGSALLIFHYSTLCVINNQKKKTNKISLTLCKGYTDICLSVFTQLFSGNSQEVQIQPTNKQTNLKNSHNKIF